MVMPGLQDPDAHDHHQVGGRVHAQPGGVHLAHALALQPQRGRQALGRTLATCRWGADGRVARATGMR